MTHTPATLHAKSRFTGCVAHSFDRPVSWPTGQLLAGLSSALASSAVLAALLSLAACSQRPSPPAAGGPNGAAVTRGGELVASFRTDPTTFNRHMSRDSSTSLLTVLTHARLVRINQATQELEPQL